MPDLTVTVTSTQATRLSAAFAFVNGTPANPAGTPATGPQIEAWLRDQLRARVRLYERRNAHVTADATVDSTLGAEGWTP